MKYFIVADVHSFYDEMLVALNETGFNKDDSNHCFVSLGDLFDRGPKSKDCLNFVLSLNPQRRIFIRGNHEDLIQDAMDRGYLTDIDYSNGTAKTVLQLGDTNIKYSLLTNLKRSRKFKRYLNECVNYYETQDAIFVHGWIPYEVDPKLGFSGLHFREATSEEWKEARWSNGMQLWEQGIRIPNKTIFCGHFHTSWGHSRLHNEGVDISSKDVPLDCMDKVNWDPFIDKGIVALDTCTVISKKVNCYVLEDEPLNET